MCFLKATLSHACAMEEIMVCASVQDRHVTTGRINQAGVLLC